MVSMVLSLHDHTKYRSHEDIVMSLSTIVGVLVFLDEIGLRYNILYAGVWRDMEFNLGINFSMLLMVLFALQLYVSNKKSFRFIALIPVVLLLLYPFLGLLLALSLASLLNIVVYLLHLEDHEIYLFWFFSFNCFFMLYNVIHWTLFLPLGIDILEGFAFVEYQLYYVCLLYTSPSPRDRS